MIQNCIFCRIVKGEIPSNTIYSDDRVMAFLDIHPWNPGHVLLIPKAHFATLDECPPEIVADLARVLPLLARAIMAATGCKGYNVLNNNGREAGQLVDHVHFHLVPRREGDRIFTHGPQGEYQSGEAQKMTALIREKLEKESGGWQNII